MIDRIIVTVDEAREQEGGRDCTLDCAALIAQRTGARVSLVHMEPRHPVAPELEGVTPYRWEGIIESAEAADEATRAEESTQLEGLGERLEREWVVATEGEVVGTDSPVAMRRLVRQLGGDLLVARHGEEPCATGHLGEVSEQVMERVGAPVLFVPPPACDRLRQIRTVLVPLDGSHASESILPAALAILPDSGAVVHLLAVVPAHRTLASIGPGHGNLASEARAQAYLDSVASRAALAGVAVETIVRAGEPAAVIREEAERIDADLLAMATRGHTGFKRVLLGSVTHRILESLDRPLLVAGPSSVESAEGRPLEVWAGTA